MAQRLIVLAFCLVAIIGLVKAVDNAPTTSGANAEAPAKSNDVIGNTEDAASDIADAVAAGPLGNEGSMGPSGAQAPASGHGNSAASLQFSTFVGVATATMASFFF